MGYETVDATSIRVKIGRAAAQTVTRTVDQSEAVKRRKAYGDYSLPEIRVLGVPFGGPVQGRDEDGEAFHDGTDIWLSVGDVTPLTYYHGYGPDDPLEMQAVPAIIGVAKYTGADERGHWFDARLDESEPLALRITNAMGEGGGVRASSGAVSHLVRMGKAGLIDVWPVGELAVFDTNEWRLPANDYAVVEAKGITQPEIMPEEAAQVDDTKAASVQDEGKGEPDAAIQIEQVEHIKSLPVERLEVTKMDENTVQIDYEAMAKAMQPIVEQAVEAKLSTLRDEPPVKTGAVLTEAPAVIKARGEWDKDAFFKYLRTGKAALQEDTPTEGGYLVPNDFYPNIVAKRDEMSIPRRAGARVIGTSRDYIDIPVEDSSLAKFAITAEEAAVDQNEPTFGQVSVKVHKFTKLIKISEELLEDNAANLEAFLSDALARAWAETENYYTLVGTGSGQPQGVFIGGTAGLTFDGSGAIAVAEIPELYFKLGDGYISGAVWVMRNATLGYLQGLTGNNFQLVPTPASAGIGQTPFRLWNHDVFTSDSAAAIAASAKTVCWGNWNFYGLVERRGMRVRRLNELYAGNGQVGILATARWGGAVLQAEAFQYGTQHA
jgi:HK97 family phage major capsid protein